MVDKRKNKTKQNKNLPTTGVEWSKNWLRCGGVERSGIGCVVVGGVECSGIS